MYLKGKSTVIYFFILNNKVNFNRVVQDLLQQQKQRVLYKEDFMSDVVDVSLGIGGLLPGVGEIFDVTLAIRHARRGEHLNAVLCLISCIPVIGDVIGKGTMIANFLAKLARYTRTQGRVGRTAAKGITGARNTIQQASPVIINLKRKILKNKYQEQNLKK